MTAASSAFVHRFIPRGAVGPGTTLLLLHGTGADENDLISLGAELLPGAALLSPRGRVLEHGMPRFFRRLAEGVFDLDDLKIQTGALAQFILDASAQYGLSKIIAVGYSNGANIANSLLLTHPGVLAGAILFRPMVTVTPDVVPNLKDVPILLAAARHDQIVPPDHTAQLSQIFTAAGARVTVHWHPGGHELGNDDIAAAKKWLTT